MRPHQRPRTGQRRDGEVRVIRTEFVRYPGHEHPLIDAMDDGGSAGSGSGGGSARPSTDDGQTSPGATRLRVRDTGLALEGRAARAERMRNRNRRRLVVSTILVVSALLLAVFGWRYASDQRAAQLPLDATSSSSAANVPIGAAHLQAASSGDTFRSTTRPPDPTPYFASYGRLNLRLPVEAARLTEIGFHQASYAWAAKMKTPLKDAKLTESNTHRGTGRDLSTQPTSTEAFLVGRVLRMWRARPGQPDTAADVGANPGSKVLSPVTGTVVKIKSYKLYGKWSDYEMHIAPDGYPNLDIVMIHLVSPKVKVGDRVVAGVTQVAQVRKLSDKFTDQLAQYVRGGGDHVHLQVNKADYPGYKGLVGAVEPDEPTGTVDAGD
jgi:murein DD-endopeptidase MepM/ murein hydrolase activator NlpD